MFVERVTIIYRMENSYTKYEIIFAVSCYGLPTYSSILTQAMIDYNGLWEDLKLLSPLKAFNDLVKIAVTPNTFNIVTFFLRSYILTVLSVTWLSDFTYYLRFQVKFALKALYALRQNSWFSILNAYYKLLQTKLFRFLCRKIAFEHSKKHNFLKSILLFQSHAWK